MSTEIAVELPLASLPSARAIAAQVQLHGVDIAFPEGLDLANDFGLEARILCGQFAGFEYTPEDPAPPLRRLVLEARASYADSFLHKNQVSTKAGQLQLQSDPGVRSRRRQQ